MKIVCAASVLYGAEAFGTLGETVVVPDGEISSAVLKDADALIVRSKTRVTPELLNGTSVQFVGTATAGFDHLDVDYLQAREIGWTEAGGCNANSVAEYVVAALLHLVEAHGLLVEDLTLGIVGVGNVGKAVLAKVEALGMRVLQNDPPRQCAENNPDLIELDAVLSDSDVVTLHTPLIDEGPFPTRHLANHRFFEQMQRGSLFINACRGEVTDSDALLTAMDSGVVRAAVLDVWEDEPTVRRDVLDRVDLGSAHIAGYSFEGKLNGTLMVYEDACQFFEMPSTFDASNHAPPPPAEPIVIDGRGRLAQDILHEAVRRAYDIRTDDQLLRESPDGDKGGAYFNGLRRGYRLRREFPCFRIQPVQLADDVQQTLMRLGFALHSPSGS